MTIEELLKSRGWTDADLESVKPMLADARFRSTLEETYSAIATERDTLKTDIDAWNKKLVEEYQPRIDAAEKTGFEARRRAAELEEGWKVLQENGYVSPEFAKEVFERKPAVNTPPSSTTNENYVTKQQLDKTVTFFSDAEGEAIARANDLALEYQHLTGKSIFEYETQIGDRSMRGMTALRAEAKTKGKPLPDYVSEKFDFSAKRAAKQAEARAADEARIRADERSKAMSEFTQQYGSNPNTRFAMPSNVPAIPKPRQDQQHPFKDDGAMSSAARREQRISHALSEEAKARSGRVM